MNAPRPLFFRDLVAFDSDAHRSLRLPAERKHFAFAAQATLLPITFAEVGPALRHYPVVFVAEGERVALVAMTGLADSGNRFVDARGEWRPGAYIPAYVRGYPFIAIRTSETTEPILALDPQAADFMMPGGQKLISADGKPSEQLKGILAFHAEYRQLAERTQMMTQALKNADVLEQGSLQIQPNGAGEPQQIGGFLVVSEQKLKALTPDALKTLLDADALGLAYAQLLSMQSLGNVFNAPAAVPSSPILEATSTKPKVRRTKKAAE
jgi:hypothetical protein